MSVFQVTWGEESRVVQADDANEAWSKFADGHLLARQFPKLHVRKVLEVTDEPQPVLLVEAAPVVQMTYEDMVVEHVDDMEDEE